MAVDGIRWWRAALLFGLFFGLSACAHAFKSAEATSAGEDAVNVYPTNFKTEILAAMHAYLNDPTGVRDSGLSEPSLKTIGGNKRYVACVRFNPKGIGKDRAGIKEIAAVFIAGRFDRFVEVAVEQCAAANYAAFPELEKLPR